jgi:hypothetical protein
MRYIGPHNDGDYYPSPCRFDPDTHQYRCWMGLKSDMRSPWLTSYVLDAWSEAVSDWRNAHSRVTQYNFHRVKRSMRRRTVCKRGHEMTEANTYKWSGP